MKLLLSITAFMLMPVGALACGSFDECMNGREAKIWIDCYDKNCYQKGDCPSDVGLPGSCARTKPCSSCYDVIPIDTNYVKAIAFKLDEISRKLEEYDKHGSQEFTEKDGYPGYRDYRDP